MKNLKVGLLLLLASALSGHAQSLQETTDYLVKNINKASYQGFDRSSQPSVGYNFWTECSPLANGQGLIITMHFFQGGAPNQVLSRTLVYSKLRLEQLKISGGAVQAEPICYQLHMGTGSIYSDDEGILQRIRNALIHAGQLCGAKETKDPFAN